MDKHKDEQTLQNGENSSTRIQGFWALFLVLCGIVTAFADITVTLFCDLICLFIWLHGCGKRGEKYWPVIFAGQRYLVHCAFMLCVMAILVGIALRHDTFLLGAFAGLSVVMSMLSLDLIFYDTKEKYEEKFQLFEQIEHNDTKGKGSVLFQLLDTKLIMLIMLILTLLMLVIIFIAEYKNVELQITEWWSQLFRETIE